MQALRYLLRNRWIRWSAALLLLLLTTILGLAWYTRTWTRSDVMSYWGMSRECHPVWRELFWRRIGPGQDVEEVIAATKPTKVDRYGDFALLTYQERLYSDSGSPSPPTKASLIAASAGKLLLEPNLLRRDGLPEDRKGLSTTRTKPTGGRFARSRKPRKKPSRDYRPHRLVSSTITLCAMATALRGHESEPSRTREYGLFNRRPAGHARHRPRKAVAMAHTGLKGCTHPSLSFIVAGNTPRPRIHASHSPGHAENGRFAGPMPRPWPPFSKMCSSAGTWFFMHAR